MGVVLPPASRFATTGRDRLGRRWPDAHQHAAGALRSQSAKLPAQALHGRPDPFAQVRGPAYAALTAVVVVGVMLLAWRVGAFAGPFGAPRWVVSLPAGGPAASCAR